MIIIKGDTTQRVRRHKLGISLRNYGHCPGVSLRNYGKIDPFSLRNYGIASLGLRSSPHNIRGFSLRNYGNFLVLRLLLAFDSLRNYGEIRAVLRCSLRNYGNALSCLISALYIDVLHYGPSETTGL